MEQSKKKSEKPLLAKRDFSYEFMVSSSSDEDDEESDYEQIPSFSDMDQEPLSKLAKVDSPPSPTPPQIQPKYVRCKTCRQIIEDLPTFDATKFSIDYLEEVMSEEDAVTDDRICVEGLDEDALPDYLLNDFTLYDKEGHLVALDAHTHLIEKGMEIKFSGIIKSFCKDHPGIPVLDAGPIGESNS